MDKNILSIADARVMTCVAAVYFPFPGGDIDGLLELRRVFSHRERKRAVWRWPSREEGGTRAVWPSREEGETRKFFLLVRAAPMSGPIPL